MKNIIVFEIFVGYFTTFITNIYGGWKGNDTTLLIFVLLDYVMGVSLALIFKKSNKTKTGGLSSRVGFIGICKKITIFALIIVANRLDVTLGCSPYVKDTVVYCFMINELISIFETVGLMGLKLPTILTKSLDVMKERTKNE